MQWRERAALIALSMCVASCSDAGPTEPDVPVTVETETLAEAIEGRAYSQALEAVGGSGSYTWAVTSGSLPAGLSLSPQGTIAGTPSVPGPTAFQVRATDSDGRTATADLAIEVTGRLTVHTSALSDAVAGVAYDGQLVAVGGRPDHTWTRTGGTAGAWLVVSTDGKLTGAPDAAGSFTVAVAVADASGQESTRELALVVRDPVAVVTTAMPEATEWRPYGVQLEASGGDGGYTWDVVDGGLPAGVELGAAGAITGSPEEPGSFPFTVQAVDGIGLTATRPLTLVVEPAPLVRTTGLPAGTPGVVYSTALQAVGGTGAYAWSLIDGALPAGLALSTAGVVSGTPSASGSYAFTVRVTDEADATDRRDLSLTVVDELQTLENDVPVAGLWGDAGSNRYFVVDVPAETGQLTVSISGGTGDADLYLRHGTLPQDYAYDCRPLRQGNDETCTAATPASGPWYVRLRGFEAYQGVTLVATLEN
jgi:hypothetical protein